MEKILDLAYITLNKNSVPGESCFGGPVTVFCLCGWLFFYLLSSFVFHSFMLILHLLLFIMTGDKSAQVPGGIRIGSPAMTTRGFTEKEFILVADFIHEGVQIALDAKRSVSGSKLQDFMKFVTSCDFSLTDRVSDLRARVEALTTQFPMPGVWFSDCFMFRGSRCLEWSSHDNVLSSCVRPILGYGIE